MIIQSWEDFIFVDTLSKAKKYYEINEWEKAKVYFDEYFKDRKDIVEKDMYFAYGKCLMMLSDYEGAKAIFLELLTLRQNSVLVLKELRSLYTSIGDWNSGIEVAHR